MTDKLNVYQKLFNVRQSVSYIKKGKQGKQFDYVGSSDVLGSLSAAINEERLLLKPEIISSKVTEGATKSGTTNVFTELTMRMTWINVDDPSDVVVCEWYTQGMDLAGEKGVGKALTYAEKYFLLKFFNIATDKDDPDAFQDKIDKSAPPKLADATQIKVLKEKLNELAEKEGDTFESMQARIFNYLKISVELEKITADQFGLLINNITKALQVSNKKNAQEPRQDEGLAWE